MSITEVVARAITDKLTKTAVMLPTGRVVVTDDVAEAAIVAVIDWLIAEAGERVVVSDRDDHVADGVDLSDWLADYKETP